MLIRAPLIKFKKLCFCSYSNEVKPNRIKSFYRFKMTHQPFWKKMGANVVVTEEKGHQSGSSSLGLQAVKIRKCNTGSNNKFWCISQVCQWGSPSLCLQTADDATTSGPQTQTETDAAVIMMNGASRIGTTRFLLDKWCNILLFNNKGR